MRATIPEEKAGRWIVKERREMLARPSGSATGSWAKPRAGGPRGSQTEIVKLASGRAGDHRRVRGDSRETRLEMEDWADSILSTLEVNLDKFLGAVKRGRERLHERSQETVVAGIAGGSSNNDDQPYQ